MTYKNHEWPCAPDACAGSETSGRIVVKGHGKLSGKDAYEKFRQMALLFYDMGPGLLSCPAGEFHDAQFVSPSLDRRPRPDYVEYSFEFWAPAGQGAGSAPES